MEFDPKKIRVLDLSGEKERGRGNFLLRPRAVMYPMVQDTAGKPQKHKDFIIINVGKAEIKAELEFGTRESKIGVLEKRVLKPGEEVALKTGDGKFEITTVRITNATKIKAAFQMEGGESILPPSAGEHYTELLDEENKNNASVDLPLDGKAHVLSIGNVVTNTETENNSNS